MKNTTEKVPAGPLIIVSSLFAMVYVLIALNIIDNLGGLDFSLDWQLFKKKELVTIEKPVIRPITKEEFIQDFLNEKSSLILGEGDYVIATIPSNILGIESSEKISLEFLKECCYDSKEIRNYVRKYRLPSVSEIFPSGKQLGLLSSNYISSGKYKIEKKKFKRIPTYLVKIGEESYIFDQQKNEMPKWRK